MTAVATQSKAAEALNKVFPSHTVREQSEDCAKVTTESFNTLAINQMATLSKDFMWYVRRSGTGVTITCTER